MKRVVPGSPADRAVSNPPGHRIQPGDSLLLINGDDVYGLGLDVLRDRIPGPAGSFVVLGFKSLSGDLFEVELQRGEYGPGPGPEPRGRYQPNQSDDGVIRAPRNRGATLRNVQQRDGGGPPTFARVPSAPGARQMPARQMAAPATAQAPIMAPSTISYPIDAMQQPLLQLGLPGAYVASEPQYIAVAPTPSQPMQLQFRVGYDMAGQPFVPQMPMQMQHAQQPFVAPQPQYQQPQYQQPQYQLVPQQYAPQLMPIMAPGPMLQAPNQAFGQAQFPQMQPQFYQ